MVTIAILAGGRSTRMAADKALLRVGGVGMLERVARTALQVGGEVVVVGREQPGEWPAELRAGFVADAAAGGDRERGDDDARMSHGPLGGLITALRRGGSPVLVLPCDTPLLSAELLRGLLSAHRPESLATIAATDGGAEPLLAVYTVALLPVLERMQAEGRRALHPLAALAGVASYRVPPEHAHELLNVNTPADVQVAEALLQQQAQQQQ